MLMHQVIKVRLLPTPPQTSALTDMLRTCNLAASWLAGQMHRHGVFGKIAVQKRFYRDLRSLFGLSAQPTIRVIGKVTDSYSTHRANLRAGLYGPPGSRRRSKIEAKPIAFRPDAAQPFDARCLSWQLTDAAGSGTVSILTMAGRLKDVRLLGSPHQLALLRSRRVGETDLIHRDGKWFLYAVTDVPEVPTDEPLNGFLGIDLGIINIATTSDGERLSGARLNRYRKRQLRLRRRLQAKKTSSARRLLKRAIMNQPLR